MASEGPSMQLSSTIGRMACVCFLAHAAVISVPAASLTFGIPGAANVAPGAINDFNHIVGIYFQTPQNYVRVLNTSVNYRLEGRKTGMLKLSHYRAAGRID